MIRVTRLVHGTHGNHSYDFYLPVLAGIYFIDIQYNPDNSNPR